jgi:hypothetical protein
MSQLSQAQQQTTIIFAALSICAFFAGSVNARRGKTGAGKATAIPVKKLIQTKGVVHEGEREARQTAKRLTQARGTTPAAPPEAERDASQAAKRLVQAKGTIPLAPPEVERESAQTARPQPEVPEQPLKAPRYASRSAAGTQVTKEGEETTSKPFEVTKTEHSDIDARVIEQARRESVEPSASVPSTLMIACVANNDADMALNLFDQILEKETNLDCMPTEISADTRSRFFTLVAGQLDDARLRRDGLQVLVALRAHGIQPPHILQNRLIRAWGNKIPQQVLSCFTKMREEGFTLSSAACRSIMADMVDSADEGGRPRPSLVDVAIGQNDPTCDAEEETSAVEEHTERTPLRREASTFVPKSWEGPWRMQSEMSMLRGWVPCPPGLCGDFPQMASPQMGIQRDECTTVILRNLPCPFLREHLIKEMDAKGFAGLYNFVYMPIDFRTEMSMGYAFVNLVNVEEVQRFVLAFNGFKDWPRPSAKICVVDMSRTQGLNANVERYRNSPVMGDEVPERFRPVIFDGTERVSFPEPTRELPKVFHKSIE